ncbi:MAG: hypothetical protein EBT92_19880 [Planctomycetes bacterium]|nr:hypothetical protein [Planctomycetota bacterium]
MQVINTTTTTTIGPNCCIIGNSGTVNIKDTQIIDTTTIACSIAKNSRTRDGEITAEVVDTTPTTIIINSCVERYCGIRNDSGA